MYIPYALAFTDTQAEMLVLRQRIRILQERLELKDRMIWNLEAELQLVL